MIASDGTILYMKRVYFSFKKRVLLVASGVIGFFVALISGGASSKKASADVAVPQAYQDVSGPGPCPGPSCCGA
jgi:hypothetical protein